MDVNATIVVPLRSREKPVGEGELVRKARYATAILDMVLSDDPGKCDPDLCEGLVRLYNFTKWRSQKEHARYKYYFDVSVRVVFLLLSFITLSLFCIG